MLTIYHNSENILYFMKNSPFKIFANLYYFSSIKNGSISFFLSSGMHQSHHLVECHAPSINLSFLDVLHCLYSLHGAMIVAWIIVSSSSSRLISEFIKIKVYIIIRQYNIVKYFKNFTQNRRIRNRF